MIDSHRSEYLSNRYKTSDRNPVTLTVDRKNKKYRTTRVPHGQASVRHKRDMAKIYEEPGYLEEENIANNQCVAYHNSAFAHQAINWENRSFVRRKYKETHKLFPPSAKKFHNLIRASDEEIRNGVKQVVADDKYECKFDNSIAGDKLKRKRRKLSGDIFEGANIKASIDVTSDFITDRSNIKVSAGSRKIMGRTHAEATLALFEDCTSQDKQIKTGDAIARAIKTNLGLETIVHSRRVLEKEKDGYVQTIKYISEFTLELKSLFAPSPVKSPAPEEKTPSFDFTSVLREKNAEIQSLTLNKRRKWLNKEQI